MMLKSRQALVQEEGGGGGGGGDGDGQQEVFSLRTVLYPNVKLA